MEGSSGGGGQLGQKEHQETANRDDSWSGERHRGPYRDGEPSKQIHRAETGADPIPAGASGPPPPSAFPPLPPPSPPPPPPPLPQRPRVSAAAQQRTPQGSRPSFIPPPESQLRAQRHTETTAALVHEQQGREQAPDLQDLEQETSSDEDLVEESPQNLETSSSIPPLGPTPVSPANTGPFPPKRHHNNAGQPRDLHLIGSKEWLIMGDSNIGRLPAHRMLNLQLDAFPGATFQMAETILRGTRTTDTVKKVILSFGLNDKALRSMEATTEQLLNMLVRAKEAFPKAQIFIPQ
ncbi:cyclin-dependent kinase 12-like isoform X2 [Pseudoliparis swirei]|nr:cyclin-dependent kinase 12-like isoform X2 [Pseudoliparis swirei]